MKDWRLLQWTTQSGVKAGECCSGLHTVEWSKGLEIVAVYHIEWSEGLKSVAVDYIEWSERLEIATVDYIEWSEGWRVLQWTT